MGAAWLGVACANVLQHNTTPALVLSDPNCMNLIEETGIKGKGRGGITQPSMVEEAGIDDFQHTQKGRPLCQAIKTACVCGARDQRREGGGSRAQAGGHLGSPEHKGEG